MHVDTDPCTFDAVLVENTDGRLVKGMEVLLPCECGRTAHEGLEDEAYARQGLEDALKAVAPYRPLYHWAPTERRKQIIRYGLRPRMRGTTNKTMDGWKAPYVCFADTPSWAWALSGEQRGTAPGSSDLWMTDLSRIEEPAILEAVRPTGIHEVRTAHRVYKRDLWLVGTRIK